MACLREGEVAVQVPNACFEQKACALCRCEEGRAADTKAVASDVLFVGCGKGKILAVGFLAGEERQ